MTIGKRTFTIQCGPFYSWCVRYLMENIFRFYSMWIKGLNFHCFTFLWLNFQMSHKKFVFLCTHKNFSRKIAWLIWFTVPLVSQIIVPLHCCPHGFWMPQSGNHTYVSNYIHITFWCPFFDVQSYVEFLLVATVSKKGKKPVWFDKNDISIFGLQSFWICQYRAEPFHKILNAALEK